MSYNSIINPTEAYRTALTEALVNGSELPAIDRQQYEQEAYEDELLQAVVAPSIDAEELMALQKKYFGDIDSGVFASVMAYVDNNMVDSYAPDAQTFQRWHDIHERFYADVIHEINEMTSPGTKERTSAELVEIFTHALQVTGLDQKGWRVILGGKVNLVGVASAKKRIIVTKRNVILSRKRLIGVVIHEVGIHALFAEYHAHRDRDVEEGLGTLVEQLTLSTFHPLRLYRYLAISFAIGMDGTKRTARDTYELLVDMRRQLRPDESVDSSRRFIATELIRAYRTLPTDTPGIVYMRDKKYIEHNAKLWSTLRREAPTLENYQKLVEPWRNEK